jgi:hypothetical protein
MTFFLGGVEVPFFNKSSGWLSIEVPCHIENSSLFFYLVVSISSFVLVSLSGVETSAGNQPLAVFFFGFLFVQAFVRHLNTSIG